MSTVHHFERRLQQETAEIVGNVVSVSGSQVVALLEGHQVGAAAVRPSPQMGALVKFRTASTFVFGMVSAVSIPVPARDVDERELRIIEVDLLGEAALGSDGTIAKFARGVSSFPSLGDAVLETTPADLNHVYAQSSGATVRIDAVHQDRSIPAHITTDDMLGKHFAILGTTGSGKSCAAALMLHSILDKHPNAHVLLLDPHNEYAHAFGDRAEMLSTGDLELPYWLFNFEEISEVVLCGDGDSRNVAEAAILHEAIVKAKREAMDGSDTSQITADTPVPYRLSDLMRLIDDAAGRLSKPEAAAPYIHLKSRISALESDPRYGFMFGGILFRDNLIEIISRIFRIPVAGKPITIVDLSAIPSEILNVVVSVLCRITFDFAMWSDGALPITLVCEEAHRYAPQDPNAGFEPTKRALARIAKEGRKYGVSLCVISQRPSELDPCILSQCNTVFALRMSNQHDQDFVRGAMWDCSRGLLDALPSLRNAEAIVVGEGVPVPMRLCFDELPAERRPKSGIAMFSHAWSKECGGEEMLKRVVMRWRHQRRSVSVSPDQTAESLLRSVPAPSLRADAPNTD